MTLNCDQSVVTYHMRVSSSQCQGKGVYDSPCRKLHTRIVDYLSLLHNTRNWRTTAYWQYDQFQF